MLKILGRIASPINPNKVSRIRTKIKIRSKRKILSKVIQKILMPDKISKYKVEGIITNKSRKKKMIAIASYPKWRSL